MWEAEGLYVEGMTHGRGGRNGRIRGGVGRWWRGDGQVVEGKRASEGAGVGWCRRWKGKGYGVGEDGVEGE